MGIWIILTALLLSMLTSEPLLDVYTFNNTIKNNNTLKKYSRYKYVKKNKKKNLSTVTRYLYFVTSHL